MANAEAIHGRIIDSQDIPVAQAHLTLLNAGETAIAHATSDTQGGFTLQNIDAGVYQISAEAPYSSRLLLMSLLAGASKLKEISVQFHQIVSASQQVTVTASAPSSLNPIHSKAPLFMIGLSTPIRGARERRSRSPACRLKPLPEELRRRNTLRPESQAITANQSRSSIRLVISSILIICQLALTAMGC